jgi:flagellar operon protein (TIGR03826 family)
MELKNCESCGAVFVDPVRTICRDCYYKEEEAYKKVYRFLSEKKNREATLEEIVKATDVEEELIIKFMKQNRLRASEFPKLSYPCENCGVQIVEGRLCESCARELERDLAMHLEVQRLKEERKKREEPVYYTITKDKRNRKR